MSVCLCACVTECVCEVGPGAPFVFLSLAHLPLARFAAVRPGRVWSDCQPHPVGSQLVPHTASCPRSGSRPALTTPGGPTPEPSPTSLLCPSPHERWEMGPLYAPGRVSAEKSPESLAYTLSSVTARRGLSSAFICDSFIAVCFGEGLSVLR